MQLWFPRTPLRGGRAPRPVSRTYPLLATALRHVASALGGAATAVGRMAGTVHPTERVLVLGGARSGKSRHAEELLSHWPHVIYIATGNVADGADPEWAARIAAHRERRPPHWRTLETLDVAHALRQATHPVLIDCLATWLTGVLDEAGAWQESDGWESEVERRVGELVDSWRDAPVPVVAVSNEVGSGVVPATPAGRLFRDVLGSVNNRIAAASDSVRLVVAGRVLELER